MSLFIGSAGSPGWPPSVGPGGSVPVAAAAAVAAATVAAATAAAAPTAIAATAATATATAAATTLLAGAGLVHGEAATLEIAPVERGDGGLRLLVVAHLHEAEALGAPGVTIHDHLGGIHGAVLREHVLQIAVAKAIRQVTNVELSSHARLLFGPSSDSVVPTL